MSVSKFCFFYSKFNPNSMRNKEILTEELSNIVCICVDDKKVRDMLKKSTFPTEKGKKIIVDKENFLLGEFQKLNGQNFFEIVNLENLLNQIKSRDASED